MRAFAAALICVITLMLSPVPATAQGWMDDPFDPAPMSREDIATVQVSLAYTGDFFGNADGVWKDDSQKALVQYTERVEKTAKPLYRHLKDLVMFLEDERVKNDWQLFYSETTNTSYLHPFGLLKEVPKSEVEGAIEFLSDDGGFSLMVRFHNKADMQGVHDYFFNEATAGSKPYRYSDDLIWVTDAKLDDDLNVYARSDFYDNSWSTLSVVVTSDYYFRMNVVAVSVAAGGSSATLMWTDGGVIDQVVNGEASAAAAAPPKFDPSDPKDQVRRPKAAGVAEAPEPEPMPEPDPGPETIDIAGKPPLGTPKPNPDPEKTPEPEPAGGDAGGIGVSDPGTQPKRDAAAGEAPPLVGGGGVATAPEPEPEAPRTKITGTLKGSGTGFYITPTTLVTAAHVVDECGAVAMIDGTPLDILKSDSSLDLAILTGATDTGVWLKLSALEVPKLGEAVTALGFPYYTSLDQGLTVTSGNVSALRGIDGSSNRVMVTAPVQPGNSGGPLLNKKGAVIGVVVSRVDDMAILEETGSLPQNMNFAVPSGPLLTFLAQSRVTRPQGDGTGGDMSGGVPDGLANAVVPLYCYE